MMEMPNLNCDDGSERQWHAISKIDPLTITKVIRTERKGWLPWKRKFGIDIYCVDGSIHHEDCSSKQLASILMEDYIVARYVLSSLLKGQNND